MKIPNTYRFFVAPETINGDTVELTETALVHQLTRVLRLRPGQQIVLLDGRGSAYSVTLTHLDRTYVTGTVAQCETVTSEPAIDVTLYIALLRAERFEWVLQKGTELGVNTFVPVRCTRSLLGDRADERKLARWQRIVREAAEQSCRGRLPMVAPAQDFSSACTAASSADLGLILWEGKADQLRTILRQSDQEAPDPRPQSIALLSGPEGGFTADELTTVVERGIIPVSLGPRILRAETAPIAAAATIFYELA